MDEHRHKTWDEAAGLPEVSARLERLPEGLTFPDDFPEPIRFDPRRRRLAYRGFMTSNSYRYLHRRSRDPAYIAALDVLFQDSSCAAPGARPDRRARLWLLVGAGAAAAAAAGWALTRGRR
jgi:hypothetical protein